VLSLRRWSKREISLQVCIMGVRTLGIGIRGSRKTALYGTAEELWETFLRVLDGGEKYFSVREKARLLGEKARGAGGRIRAAGKIAKLARKEGGERRGWGGKRLIQSVEELLCRSRGRSYL
jgi:hypothetical protein